MSDSGITRIFLGLSLLILASQIVSAKKPDSAFDRAVWDEEKALLSKIGESEGRNAATLYLELARLFKDNERELAYLDQAEKYAAGDEDITAEIKLSRLAHFAVYEPDETFRKEALSVSDYLQLHKDRRLANARYIVIKRHIDEGRTQTALAIAKRMLNEANDGYDSYSQAYAYLSIGLIYTSLDQHFEAVDAFENSIEQMDIEGKTFPVIDRIKAGLELLEVQYSIGRHLESMETCRRTEALIEKYIEDNAQDNEISINSRSMLLFIQCIFVRNYLSLKEFDNAKKHLDLAARHLYPSIGLDVEVYNETCADYYRVTGDYARALEYAEHSINAYRDNGLLPYYLDALALKTKILADKGDWREAYIVLDYIGKSRDSLDASRFAARMSELHTLYEVDKFEFMRKRQQTLIAFSLMCCILLLAVVAVYVIYSHRLKQKNRVLYDQISANARRASNSSQVLRLAPEDSLSKEMRLFRKIAILMEQEHSFTDPAFSRTSLVRLTCSNDKYVADAIREGTGLTVAAYISELRLDYSLELLADDEFQSLDEVASDSGFGSYSSFFRAFQKKFSMTPSEYRDYARKRDGVIS
ncbi:MAG: helix-turn-helix domain-containing protein [Candidatus Cryptobacteroides sp.]